MSHCTDSWCQISFLFPLCLTDRKFTKIRRASSRTTEAEAFRRVVVMATNYAHGASTPDI